MAGMLFNLSSWLHWLPPTPSPAPFGVPSVLTRRQTIARGLQSAAAGRRGTTAGVSAERKLTGTAEALDFIAK